MAQGFDQLFFGIAQQESGGNYNAINGGSGALGKYQVMPANVGAWSQKYMGARWSTQQFLSDPAKQESLAKAVLSDYYAKWGARGAASAWYSGNPALNMNYNSQHGGPSIGSYVDSVIAKGLGFAGSPAGMVAGLPPTPQTNVDNTVQDKKTTAAPSTSGMGAVSAPGVDARTAPGAEAFGVPGVGAFGEAQPQPKKVDYAPNADGKTPAPAATGGKARATGTLPFVQDAANELGPKFSISNIGGYRSQQDGGFHPMGRALDFMTGDQSQGDALAAYAWANRARLGVTEIIYRQHILTVARANEGWRPMGDRGSNTQNHMDHVHVSFAAAPGK